MSAQKTPLVRTLSTFAQQKALDEIGKLGLGIPGVVSAVAGPMITANFQVSGLTLPQVTMPIAMAEYIRLPIQVGDKGLAMPASFYLGGISGLGGGTADDTLRGNLSNLFWIPIGTTGFASVADPNTLYLYGPNGVKIEDETGAGYISVTATTITLSVGGHTIVINSTGVIIDGKVFLTHEHVPGTYVAGSTPVTGDSGAVV